MMAETRVDEKELNILNITPQINHPDRLVVNIIKSDSTSNTSYNTACNAKMSSRSTQSLRSDSHIVMHMQPQRWSRRSYWSTTDSYHTAVGESTESESMTYSESKSVSSSISSSNSKKSVLVGSSLKFEMNPIEPLWETKAISSSHGRSTVSHTKPDGKSSELFNFCCSCVNKSHDDDENSVSSGLCST